MIIPTVGRVVWYRQGSSNGLKNTTWHDGSLKPLVALVVDVHDDRLVNLSVFDSNGIAWPRPNVLLVQEGDTIPDSSYCEWMPYQKSVAKGEIPPTLHAQAKSA